jgi:uncharacterized protein (TIGR00725 family)
MSKKRLIAVIGGSKASKQDIEIARDVGRELVKRGAAVVCGGLGGVMEAVCQGASSESGITIGILPGESRQDANKYVQIPIVTGMGYARNVAVVKSAEAVIAIGGSFGTLSEIGHAIQSDIPVIGINTWSLVKGGKINSAIIPAENAIEAVEKAFGVIVD